MNNLLTLPDSIHLGPGTLSSLPELLKPLGHKVLLVHGHRPVEDGLLVRVRKLLFDAGFEYANMGQILPNPKYGSVKRGVKIARKEGCDIILSLGGGSTLQCAKAIALGLGSKGDVWDFWTGKKKPQKVYPIASILTNPSSGSELSDGCTIVKGSKRKTIHFEQLKSSLSILDPELSLYPRYPTMNQIFLVFIRIFFAWLSSEDGRKAVAEDLMKQILDCGSALEADIHDIPARTTLYRIFLDTYLNLPKPEDNLAALGDDLAFAVSMPAGSGVSALFFAWLSLQDQKTLDAIESLKKPLGFENDGCPSVVKSLEKLFLSMGLPLDLPQAGLKLRDEQIDLIASSPTDRKILNLANTGYHQLHLPQIEADACQDTQPHVQNTETTTDPTPSPLKPEEQPEDAHPQKSADTPHPHGKHHEGRHHEGKHGHKHHHMKHAKADPENDTPLMQPYSLHPHTARDDKKAGHHAHPAHHGHHHKK